MNGKTGHGLWCPKVASGAHLWLFVQLLQLVLLGAVCYADVCLSFPNC